MFTEHVDALLWYRSVFSQSLCEIVIAHHHALLAFLNKRCPTQLSKRLIPIGVRCSFEFVPVNCYLVSVKVSLFHLFLLCCRCCPLPGVVFFLRIVSNRFQDIAVPVVICSRLTNKSQPCESSDVFRGVLFLFRKIPVSLPRQFQLRDRRDALPVIIPIDTLCYSNKRPQRFINSFSNLSAILHVCLLITFTIYVLL